MQNKTREKKTNKTVVIAGGSGVVGRHIMRSALNRGWRVRVLTRSVSNKVEQDKVKYYEWDPAAAAGGEPEAISEIAAAVHKTDFLINLAGASIGTGRFTQSLKEKLLKSRVDATRALRLALYEVASPPEVWGQASAVGYYGNTGNVEVDESTPPGNLFLSDLCVQWENEAMEIGKANLPVRLFIGRIGMVLSKDAPAWQRFIAPIRWGVGGLLGNGRQWYPWIDADDLAAAFFHLYERRSLKGIFNFTATHPVRQKELTRVAAEILRRPAFFPVPAALLRLVMGDFADELVLASCKALPTRLLDSGYRFQRDTIELQLVHLLSKEHQSGAGILD